MSRNISSLLCVVDAWCCCDDVCFVRFRIGSDRVVLVPWCASGHLHSRGQMSNKLMSTYNTIQHNPQNNPQYPQHTTHNTQHTTHNTQGHTHDTCDTTARQQNTQTLNRNHKLMQWLFFLFDILLIWYSSYLILLLLNIIKAANDAMEIYKFVFKEGSS